MLQGNTALMQAAWFGHLDMVRYLLSVGADKAVQNHQVMQHSSVQTLGRNVCAIHIATRRALCSINVSIALTVCHDYNAF